MNKNEIIEIIDTIQNIKNKEAGLLIPDLRNILKFLKFDGRVCISGS